MQANYIREVNHCYMLFQSSQSFDENSYELKMIAANKISALLPVTCSHIDDSVVFQYDISSLQPLSVFCSSHKIHKKELTGLIGNLLDALFLMEDYLLSKEHLFLDPEYLYLNWSTMEFKIAYIPYYSCDIKTSLQNLMQYLLTCLGNEDQDTVVLAYRIYHELKEPNLQLGNIRRLLISDTPSCPEKDPFLSSADASSESSSLFPHHDSSDTSCNMPQADSHSEFLSKPDRLSGESSYSSRNSVPGSSEASHASHSFRSDTGSKKLKSFLPESDTWKTALLGIPAAFLIYAVLHIHMLGYLTLIQSAAAVVCITAVSILLFLLIRKRRRKDNSSLQPSADHSSESLPHRGYSDEASSSFFPGESVSAAITPSSSLFAPFPEDEKTVLLHSSSPDSADPASFTSLRLIPTDKEHHTGLPVIDLDQDYILLGFQPDICDKVIPDPTVSRIHARIVKRDGIFYLSDLSSRNGTFADGTQLKVQEEIPLKKNMHLQFGGAGFQVQ